MSGMDDDLLEIQDCSSSLSSFELLSENEDEDDAEGMLSTSCSEDDKDEEDSEYSERASRNRGKNTETAEERQNRRSTFRFYNQYRLDTETPKEREKRQNLYRDYYRIRMETETPYQRTKRLQWLKDYNARRMANETPEEREKRLLHGRKLNEQRKANETPEQRAKRLEALKNYQRTKKQNETPEERQKRLECIRKSNKERYVNETPEQREARLEKLRIWNKNRKLHMTPEEKEKNNAYVREMNRKKRLTETPEQRQKRLNYVRHINRRRLMNETPEEREARLIHLRKSSQNRSQNETPEEREQRLEKIRQINRERIKNESTEQRKKRLAIQRFHNSQRRERLSALKQKAKESRLKEDEAARLERQRAHVRAWKQKKRETETAEERAERREKLKVWNAQRRARETAEERAYRLAKTRIYTESRRNILEAQGRVKKRAYRRKKKEDPVALITEMIKEGAEEMLKPADKRIKRKRKNQFNLLEGEMDIKADPNYVLNIEHHLNCDDPNLSDALLAISQVNSGMKLQDVENTLSAASPDQVSELPERVEVNPLEAFFADNLKTSYELACDICNENFLNVKELFQHQRKEHFPERYREVNPYCSFCRTLKFKHKQLCKPIVSLNATSLEGAKSIKQIVPPKISVHLKPPAAKLPLNTVVELTLRCPDCTVVFDNMPSLRSHHIQFHVSKAFLVNSSECKTCYDELLFHATYQIDPPSFDCIKCGEIFADMESLRDHTFGRKPSRSYCIRCIEPLMPGSVESHVANCCNSEDIHRKVLMKYTRENRLEEIDKLIKSQLDANKDKIARCLRLKSRRYHSHEILTKAGTCPYTLFPEEIKKIKMDLLAKTRVQENGNDAVPTSAERSANFTKIDDDLEIVDCYFMCNICHFQCSAKRGMPVHFWQKHAIRYKEFDFKLKFKIQPLFREKDNESNVDDSTEVNDSEL